LASQRLDSLELYGGRRGYSLLEAYSKLTAMTVVGVEEAVGEALTGGFVNLVARKLEELLSIPKFSSVKDVLEWFNHNTTFRVNTYRVGGKLVRTEDKGKAFYLVAYECPVRQVLYIEDLPGGRSLCRILCRLLSRKLSEAAGGRCEVEPARIGPNACLLRVGIEDKLESIVENVDVESEKPSLEEYEKLLMNFLSALLKSIGWALYQVLGGNPAMSYRAGKSYGRLVGASILARGYEAETLEEAVSLLNRALEGVVKVELEGDEIRVVEDKFKDIVLKESVEHPEFIDRTVQGFIAGILETLTGRRVDLRSTGKEAVYKVMIGG
jgi:predicted hydrocarbon binding protein